MAGLYQVYFSLFHNIMTDFYSLVFVPGQVVVTCGESLHVNISSSLVKNVDKIQLEELKLSECSSDVVRGHSLNP